MEARVILMSVAVFFFANWLFLLGLTVHLVNARIRHLEARAPGSASLWGGVVPMGYALSIAYWPLSLPVGLWLLSHSRLTRQARISLFWFFGIVTLLLGLLCALAFVSG